MFEEFVPSNVSPLVKVEVALLSELEFQQQVITTGGGKGDRGRGHESTEVCGWPVLQERRQERESK